MPRHIPKVVKEIKNYYFDILYDRSQNVSEYLESIAKRMLENVNNGFDFLY